MRTNEMSHLYPLPWKHETDGKQMSAVVAANGNLVCGSFICPHPEDRAAATRQAHALIVSATSQTSLGTGL